MKLEDICIILVDPESPGNIGAAARAMKTSGLRDMRLIRPCETDHADVRKLAHRSRDIVEHAAHFNNLQDALRDCHLVIGTTMRTRHNKFPNFNPEEAVQKTFEIADGKRVAFVFGNERNGLTNEQLNLCNIHSTIPTATQNPALNLSQAVMLFGNAIYRQSLTMSPAYQYEPAAQDELNAFYDHLEKAIRATSFRPRDDMPTFLSRFKRLIGRTQPEQRDINMLHKIIQILEDGKYKR